MSRCRRTKKKKKERETREKMPQRTPAYPPDRVTKRPGSWNSFLVPGLLTSVPYLLGASENDFLRCRKRAHTTSVACASSAPPASHELHIGGFC